MAIRVILDIDDANAEQLLVYLEDNFLGEERLAVVKRVVKLLENTVRDNLLGDTEICIEASNKQIVTTKSARRVIREGTSEQA